MSYSRLWDNKAGFSTKLSFNILITAIMCAAFAIISPVYAQSGLLVSPTLLEFEGNQRFASLTLVNRGKTHQTYRIRTINQRMLPNGQFAPADHPAQGEGFADKLIRFSPRQVNLAPNVPQTVRVMLRLPKGLEQGEYRTHLLFQQLPGVTAAKPKVSGPNQLGIQVIARFGISIPIFVRRGALTSSAKIVDARPAVGKDGKSKLSLKIERTGNKSVRGNIIARKNGRDIGKLRNVALYLSTRSRTIDLPVASSDLDGGSIEIEFAMRPEDGGKPFDTRTVKLR